MASKQILFKVFCDLCDNLQKLPKSLEKDALLSKFITEYKKIELETLSKDQSNAKPSLYPAIRLLIPEFERERGPYGLKETAFAKLLIKELCLFGTDADKLSNYKVNAGSKNGGDFAEAAYWVLRKRCKTKSNLTLDGVNEVLDKLALCHSQHKPRDFERTINSLIKLSTAGELKWIIRIILKDLKLGMGNNRLLKIFHEDAPDLYDVCSNLDKVCQDLFDSNIKLHELEVTVFTPFRPMLSLRCDKNVLESEVNEGRELIVENKFDGERFQLHMENGVFKYFSKNGYEYSSNYGHSYNSSGLITPYLESLFRNVRNVILDGEMMGWNKKSRSFGSKGFSYDVKNFKDDNVHRPCFCVFDILLFNGRVLTNESLKERLKIMDSLIFDIDGVIMKSKRIITRTKQEMVNELNRSVDNQEEGICFKDPNSIYKPNNRKAGWWKMKPEFFDGVMTELDVIILGGCYGEGRRRGLVSSFVLGVAVEPEQLGQMPSVFYSFAKVASGFTIEQFDTLIERLNPHWKNVNKKQHPENIIWTKEKPDVWIEPRNSVILQVKASELARSTEFKTPYTLRFARLQEIRYDKPWYTCMTTDELDKLTPSSNPVEKLNARHLTTDDIQVVPKKRARKNKSIYTPPTLESEAKTNIFQNKEICIFTGNEEQGKTDLELKILENGGNIVQIDGPSTFCVIVGDITTAVDILSRNNPRDIVRVEWLLKCLNKNKLIRWKPDDMINMSQKTKQKFAYSYDKYGDSYTKPVTKEKLIKIMENMEDEDDYLNLIPQEMNLLDIQLLFKNPLGLFRMCFGYFVKSDDEIQANLLKNLELDFVFYGGVKSETILCHTTHIIVHSENIARVEVFKQQILEDGYWEHTKIVNHKWIQDCISKGRLLNEDSYIVSC